MPAERLSIPWKDKKKGQKISDHDAVTMITLHRTTERRPQGEQRIHADALTIPEVRRYVARSVAQLHDREGDAQHRFDAWARDVVAKCHSAHKATAKATAKARAQLERAFRNARRAHTEAQAAHKGKKEAQVPKPADVAKAADEAAQRKARLSKLARQAGAA